jgi:hypothetical protein
MYAIHCIDRSDQGFLIGGKGMVTQSERNDLLFAPGKTTCARRSRSRRRRSMRRRPTRRLPKDLDPNLN